MNFFNRYIKNKNKNNTTDYGLLFAEPREEKILKEKNTSLMKYKKRKEKIIKDKMKTKYIPTEMKKKLIYEFISFINQNEPYKINLIKYSLNMAIELEYETMYFMLFYTEFSDTKHIRPFNIFFIVFVENNEEINMEKNLAYIKIIGTKSASDISFGTDYKLLKGKLINVFKEEPIKLIYNQTKINNYLNNRENITDGRYQRGLPQKKFKTIKPVLIEPTKKIIMKIGEKCLNDKNNKVIMSDCNESKKYKYNNKNIINENNYCLSYHKDNNLSFVPCDVKGKCEKDSKINNCKEFKIRKYGSLEISELNKCLDDDLSKKDCKKTKKIKIY